VSNHGGNVYDGAPATLRVLPDILDAVGSDAEVLVDSGVRRGGDVVKALALGARAVLVGRASAYGFMADGEDGVRRVLEVIRDELDQALAYIGCPSVRELDSSYIDARRLN
jgi:isopentenyl diphosphate isomerase/L-lactate dehydrogenase-like FMN-dependent dehydrogenase